MQSLKNVRVVNTIFGWSADVNASLSEGWTLLLVQEGDKKPIFVLGWEHQADPPSWAASPA